MSEVIPDNAPILSFDINMGRGLEESVDIDYPRLINALADSGIPEDKIPDLSIHFNDSRRIFNYRGATLKNYIYAYKFVRPVAEILSKFNGFAEHQFDYRNPITISSPDIYGGRRLIKKLVKGSLGVELDDELDGLSYTDCTSLVLAHEARHAANALQKNRREKRPKRSARHLVNEATSFVRYLAAINLLEESVIYKPILPAEPYLSLAIIGAATFIRRGAHFKKPKEIEANSYVLNCIQRGEANPWKDVIETSII